ncbi:hypothetical protein AC482_05510, partial [miscellaneous Crenarchaeota group-15 archaeon DG-45]
MKKEVVSTSKTPAVPGAPYSPAIKMGQLMFVAGQIPDDYVADIKTQTRQTLEKIRALVGAAGATMDNVVKTTVFLTDLGDYDHMNEVYREFFRESPPARACVQVAGLV